MNIGKNNLNVQGPSFSGHKKTLDKYGYEQHTFYYLYDSSKYNCEVELYNIEKDNKGNFSVLDKKNPVLILPMRDGGITEDLTDYDELNQEPGFAYRFKLTEIENPNNVSYGFDNGTVIGIFDGDVDNKFNVVFPNRAMINKNGAMQLIMPDEYYPGVDRVKDSTGRYQVDKVKRAKAEKAVRNHANKLGGQFIGIIKRLPDLQAEGVKRIVGTPFTKDTISSHLYWTENAYQVAPNLGTEEDFKTLQVELFKNGINWIADAALVNEGFGGIHLSETLRKGADGTCKSMFRSDERISLGIIPDTPKSEQYTRMKLVNAPFIISEDGASLSKNQEYDAKKPTYIQFYDSRLASKEQKLSQSPSRLTTYDNTNTDNVYDITRHDDAVYPFPIEVDPVELERNVKREITNNKTVYPKGCVSEDGQIYPNTIMGTDIIKKIANFSNFDVVTKEKAGGLEVWDGNVDIAKLNFYRSRQDYSRFADIRPSDRQAAVEAFDRGALAVRDYAINSGKYWTQLTADAQLQYVSRYLAEHSQGDYLKVINEASGVALPASAKDVIDKNVVSNVELGKYNLRRLNQVDARSELSNLPLNNTYTSTDYISKKLMDVPLETLPFSTNLLGIITSPYIAKKANTEDELGVSRFDLSSIGNPNLPNEYRQTYERMDGIYSKLTSIVDYVLEDIPNVKDSDGNITDYGRYVVSEVAPDLLKFLLVNAVMIDASDLDIDFGSIETTKDGDFDFSGIKQESFTMQALGIPYSKFNSKEEAQIVLSSIEKGLNSEVMDSFLPDLKKNISSRFANRSLNDFRMAEMIIDRTESGLGWRIDAAKDIASIDGIRAGVLSFDETWDNVIDFWKSYNQSILKINPHAYTTAEITDVPDLFDCEKVGLSGDEISKLQENRKYKSPGDAERKFLEETGITSLANYNYFFSLMPELFALKKFEDGSGSWMSAEEMNSEIRKKLDHGWNPEIQNNPGFLFNSPADGVENSYTFFGNHDKPRPIHCLALDMGLFNSSFNELSLSSYEKMTNRELASYVLQKPESDIDFSRISPKAIAVGYRLNRILLSNGSLSSLLNEYTLPKKEVLDIITSIVQEDKDSEAVNKFSNSSSLALVETVIDKLNEKILDAQKQDPKNSQKMIDNIEEKLSNQKTEIIKDFLNIRLNDYEKEVQTLEQKKATIEERIKNEFLSVNTYLSDLSRTETLNGVFKPHRMVAAEVIGAKAPIEGINFDKINPMAIAMGQRLNDVLSKTMGKNEEIAKSIATLALGTHKGASFDSTAFGTRPFDIAIDTVFDETEYRTGKKIENREELKAATLKEILVPAYDRYKSMYKLLLSLPGSPTDFAGDRVGTTGYETKAKNYHQQNRNTIHWEWLEDSKYSFVKTIYDEINAIANLRNRPELSALNNGSTLSTPIVPKDSEKDDVGRPLKVQSMIRYNQDSVVIAFSDSNGTSQTLDKKMDRGDGKEISDSQKRVYFLENLIKDDVPDNEKEVEKGKPNPRRGLKFGLPAIDASALDVMKTNNDTKIKELLDKAPKFKNVLDLDDPNSPYYIVVKDEKGYFLQKYKTTYNTTGGPTQETQPIVIEPRDLNTLLLCKVK